MTDQLSLDPVHNLDMQVDDLLLGRVGPWPLLGKQRLILGMLRGCKGLQRARPLSELAHQLDMQPRDVKAAVKSLVEDFGLPIGASRQAPFGYFLCVTEDDVKAAVRPLVNELISIARRVRALGGQNAVEEIFGQLPLILKGDGDVAPPGRKPVHR